MKKLKIPIASLMLLGFGCGIINSPRKNQFKSKPAMGTIMGAAAGNATLGSILGSTIGGIGGAAIGNEMDKQVAELKATIPGALVERVGEGIVVEFNSNFMFGSNRSSIAADSRQYLDKMAEVLIKYSDTNIEIQSHTDNVGSASSNLRLSSRRSNSVLKYLTQKNIPADRLHTKDFGETAPKYDNGTDEGRMKNRRVEFLISAGKKMVADAGQTVK